MELNYHRNMVRKSLKRLGFGSSCIDCAVEGNEGQDTVITLNPMASELSGQDNTEYHFDGCDFDGGARYVASQWGEIDRLIAENCQENICDIMKAFGRLSHGVQDFYAHSNYIELGGKEPWDLDPESLPDGIQSGRWILSFWVCRQEGKECPNHAILFPDHDDLNKDKPGRPNFGKALRLAYKHTKQLAQQLKDKLPKDCFSRCG